VKRRTYRKGVNFFFLKGVAIIATSHEICDDGAEMNKVK